MLIGFFLIIAGYTYFYAGVSKFWPSLTDGKETSIWDATGLGSLIPWPTQTKTTAALKPAGINPSAGQSSGPPQNPTLA